MSRAGYCDDLDDPLEHGRWRAQVRSATRGKRGQKLLRDLLAALDAMPEKRLVGDVLEVSAEADEKHAQSWVKMFGDIASADRYRKHHVKPRSDQYREGDVCALGALGRVRGLDMSELDPDEPEGVASAFDIASQLAREIVYINDECGYRETPEQKWTRMRAWVASQIIAEQPT